MPRRFVVALALIAAVGCSGESAKYQHFANGERLLAEGQPAKAVVEFQNAVKIDDRWGEARLKLADASVAAGENEQAFREYLRAADLLPDNPAVQLKAAKFLLLAGQYEDARTRAQRVLDSDPANLDAHIALGNALAGLRDLDGAILQLTEAMRLDPSRSQAHASMGFMRVAQGDLEAARASFERAVATDERSVTARLALANFQWSRGDMPAVEQSLMQALEIDRTNEITNRALATFYMETGRAPLAEPYLKVLSEAARTPDARLALADYYAAYDRRNEARAVLEPLARGSRVGAAAETRLAELQYSDGHREAAHKMVDDLLVRNPNMSLAQLLKSQWLITEGKPEEALERAKLALAASPRWIVALYTRGVAEARTRRITEAITTFSEVLRRNPRAVDAQVQLSALHLSRNDPASARQLAEDAVRNAPTSVDAAAALIRALDASGDASRAQAELARLVKLSPKAAAVHELSGLLQAEAGKTRPARQSFERALDADPANFSALVGLARLTLASGDAAAVRPRVEERLKQDPDNPAVLLLAARVRLATRDVSGAEALLKHAITIDPVDTANFALLAQIYVEEKRLDAALAVFDALAVREPSNVAARAMAAVIVHAQGNVEEAAKRYEEVLKREPRLTVALNNLAGIYADRGENLDVAQRLAETAVSQLPTNPDIRDTLGWVYYGRAQYGRALTEFQQSLATGPVKADYHYHVGLAYGKTGDMERARAALQSALKLRPQYPEATAALSALDKQVAEERARVR